MKKYLKKNLIVLSMLLVGCSYQSYYNLATSIQNIELENVETEKQKENRKNKLLFENIDIGAEVEFGRFYDYDENNEIIKIPLKWEILDIDGEFCLLITKNIIKAMPFNYEWISITWKDSDIRTWCNYDFYDIAFNDDEKKYICEISNENKGNSKNEIVWNFNTVDRVFILSIEEFKKYFKNIKDSIAVGTKYAINEGLWISRFNLSVGNSVWWLRSPGKNSASAALIYAAGGIGYDGDGVATRGNGIRPCVWVKMS